MRISDWSSDVCSSDLLSLLARRDEAQAIAGKLDRGQTAAREDAAVDPDAMRQHGGAFRGVAMHHRHRMRPVVAAEERLADPQHVVLGLIVERAAGMQAGVDEEVRSEEHTSELQSLMRLSD